MTKKTIKDIKNLAGKRIFVTCDFNISLHNGKVANDTRIIETLPTINYLTKQKCQVILASHLDRPDGYDLRYSLKPVAKRLEKLANLKVELVDNFWQQDTVKKITLIPKNVLILLENIRFRKEEKENDPQFSRYLSQMADLFVNDAFASSHRIHASIIGITQFLPGFAGLALEKEIKVLTRVLNNPQHPFVVFIGGAKTPEKISVIDKLLELADTVVLGGAIANTFLAAWGFGMGQSLVDYEMVEMARVVFWKATRKHSALILPVDVVINNKQAGNQSKIVKYDMVESSSAIFDIGPKTNQLYKQLAQKAKTIIWNGPMGFYENSAYKKGTDTLFKDIASSSAFKIVGGGDTLSCLNNKNYLSKFDHVSTGGSAMLEFLKMGTLPGVEVLQNK